MRRSCLLIALILAPLLPQPAAFAANAATKIFSTNFSNAQIEVTPGGVLRYETVTFIMQEMTKWNTYGILLYPSDIFAAMSGDDFLLCSNKMMATADLPFTFMTGQGVASGPNPQQNDVNCADLKAAINSMVEAEQEIQSLGNELTAIVNAGELSTAGETHRPADVGLQTLLVNRVWSGTGSRVLPWPGSTDPATPSPADDAVKELDDALKEIIPNDGGLDEKVWRFHHGYFRDKREADPALAMYGVNVAEKLRNLAEKLKITGDTNKVGGGEYVTPKLTTPNVSLWARADDLGLHWTVPDHMTQFGDLLPAGEYPEYHEYGDALAYPYSYTGPWEPDPETYATPLCSRTSGMLGYLCRPVEEPMENCTDDNDTDIVLKLCTTKVRVTTGGPEICPDFRVLFQDTGAPLEDPANPGKVNAALSPASTKNICDPQNRVLYKDDILSHACYTAFCLAQSMSGHTLVTNRNGTLVNEMTSPYLGCLRQDPQLGLYSELSQVTPISLPRYIGHELVHEFELEYCNNAAKPATGLSGVCTYRENRRANAPLGFLGSTAVSLRNELAGVELDQEIFQNTAMLVGQRVAQEQAAPVITKVIDSFANNVLQTATLLQDLRNAPLTITPCTWTGPFEINDNIPPPAL